MNLRWVVLLGACSNSINMPFTPTDGSSGDGNVLTLHDLSADDGPTLSGFDLSSDPQGPTVTIVSPAKDSEVAYDTLTVIATVVGKNSAFIDGSTVKLVIPANNIMGFTTAPMTLTAMQDTYEGQIDISGIKSGPSDFTVSAADVDGKIGNASSTYIHDHGPVITIISPMQPTAHGSLYVQVEVRDTLHPITDVTKVKATIRSGDNIMLTAVANSTPLRMQGTVDFNGYSPELDGDQLLTVTATNDHGTMGRGIKQFTVDNSGPAITFVNPLPGQFIGGVLRIQADVSDISGVADASVIAVFGGDLTKAVLLKRTDPTMPTFEGLFDVRQLGTNYVLPTLSVRADDLLGLHSEVGEEIVVDNVPPLLSMDPGPLFVGVVQPTGLMQCSQPFDPVGEETANDLTTVVQVVTLRARIEDRANDAPGLLVRRASLVDHNSVFLYGIPTSSGPLAVDTDGDGFCDDVNPELLPTANISASNQAIALQMTAISPGGALDLRPSPIPAGVPGQCDAVGTANGMLPAPLCPASGTQMRFVIAYTPEGEPAIWTIPPVSATAAGCVGLQFDTLNRMPEGPACFAVIARDNAGNHSVSPPLRVCIDRGGNMCSGWPPGSPPNCLGTYDKAMMKTNTTACSFRPGFSNFLQKF